MILCLLFGTMSVSAAESTQNAIYHVHDEECGETTSLRRQESDDSRGSGLRTVSEDTCGLCGGYHAYYRYDSICSCGKEWHTSGHACINSPAGTNGGDCSNYSYTDTDTSHMHPVTTFDCGFTTDTEVGQIYITSSTDIPTKELDLTVVLIHTSEFRNTIFTWSDMSVGESLHVTANGEYSINISGSNITSTTASITVANIDTEAPEIVSFTANTNKKDVKKVILTADARDNMGLATEAYSWDGGKTWSDNNSKTIKKNGTVKIYVRDIAGNVSNKTFKVTNIYEPEEDDKDTSPSLLVDLYPDTKEPAQKVILTATCNKPAVLYSWDGGKTWSNNNTTTATANALHTVLAKDASGDMATKSYNVTNIYTAFEEEEEEENVEEEVSEEIVPEEEGTEEVSEEPLSEEPTTEKQEIKDVNSVPPGEAVNEEEEKTKSDIKLELEELLVISTISASGGGFLCFFCFFWIFNKNAVVLSQDGMTEKRLGKTKIKKSGGGYVAVISVSLLNKATSNRLKIVPAKRIIKKCEGMYCRILVAGKAIETRIDKEIIVEVGNG